MDGTLRSSNEQVTRMLIKPSRDVVVELLDARKNCIVPVGYVSQADTHVHTKLTQYDTGHQMSSASCAIQFPTSKGSAPSKTRMSKEY